MGSLPPAPHIDPQPEPRGVTTAEEHASALLPVYRAAERGARLRVLPHRDDASFLERLEAALMEGTAALVMSLVSHRNGKVLTVEPRGGDAAGIVARMWSDDRIVIKLLEGGGRGPDAIRISFWALHTADEMDRVADALGRQARVPA